MANTRQIKRRISASQNISKITKAMEMVAASKMRKAQEQALAARPYARALEQSLEKVALNTDASVHPLLAKNEIGKDVALIISTNKGQCGSLNTTLFKAALHWLEKYPDGEFIVVGKKGINFCRVAGLKIYAQFTDVPERLQARDVLPISSLIMNRFLEGEFRSVHLLYMDFINTLSQKLRNVQVLPIQRQAMESEAGSMPFLGISKEYTFEPEPRILLSQLLPYYIENLLYQSFLEGRASEHSARMVAMKNASENAADLVSELKLIFNKSRQAGITSELLDITTAALTVS
jgi:F-type H+-transporting ATPase subunit gamma